MPALANESVPPDVLAFMRDRDTCDHFRGEPHEGDSAEMKKRRNFILKQMDKFCKGTDKRLADLKQKYRDDQRVRQQLNLYEEKIEGN